MITEEEKKPKVLSTEELLKRFNAQKAGTPGVLNEDLDPWGSKLVDIDTMLSGKPKRPQVPQAKPVAEVAPAAGTEKKQGYWEGLGRKLMASGASLGDMAMSSLQGAEALVNSPMVTLTEMMVNRQYKRGEIDEETKNYLIKEAAEIAPKIGRYQPTAAYTPTIGEKINESKVGQAFENDAQAWSESVTRHDKTASQYLKSGQFGKALEAVSYGIAESLAPTLAAAFVPGGAAVLGVGTAGQTFDDVKDREDMYYGQKVADAVTVGMFEWLFERFGSREMGKALMDIYQKSGKEGVVKAFTSPATKNLIAKAYKKFGVWFAPVHEGISEGLTTLGQNAAAILSGEDPERKIADGFWDSVLIGAGMGGMFSLTEKTAEQYRIAREGKAGPITGPLTIEDQDPEQMIRDLGKKYAYNGFNGELPDQNFIKYGEMKDGRKVIIKSTNFATDPANMLVAVVDAENPESKPQMVKGNMINNSMDVPYEQWVQNEMRNYQATMSQISNETAKATAPVQEGATIPIGEQLFNVTQVTDQGIVLNEIDKEGNLTANSQTITPDKYGEVFGMPADQAPQTQAPAEQVQPQAETTQQPAGEPAQPTTVSPQSRKVSDGKNEFTIIPQEDGNFRMSESFETQKEAETALKKLQERYPKLTWSAEMTDSGDLFTPDTYTIVAAPKQKPAAPVAESPKIKPEQKPVEAPAAAPEVKAEAVQPVSQTPSFPDETAAEEEVQNAGEVETPAPKGVPTYAQKKQIVLDHFGGMYEDAAASTPEQIYEQVPEVTPEDARQIHAEIKSEFEAEQDKTRNAPDPFVSIAKAEGQVDLRPTEAQKEAGNYKKGHLNIKGFDISIENPAGSVRSGVSKDGTKWSNLMNNTYGYFRRTKGKDGDQVDVFLGDNIGSDAVYVVDQVDPETGVFDEVKTMLGFSNVVDAANAYLSNYEDGWKGMGNISATDIETFKQWLKDGDTKKPYKTAGTWTKVYPGVSTMVADEGEMPKPEEQTIQVLRGSRDRGMRGVEQEFPEVSGGNGQASVAQGNAGSSGQQRGLLQGELSVDRLDNTVTEQEKHTSDNSQRQNTVSVGLGKRDGDSTTDAKAKTSELPLDNRKNSNNTGKDTEGESQEGGIAPAEDTRPVKKLKEKKGWPMSKADEARLSREPQSFEEAVYQFFIGRGRISTAALKHHLGTRSREDYASYIWAHKKDGQKTDKLNEAHIFQAHPELLKQTGDQQDQERAFMDILLSVHGLNDMRTRIDEMQRKADEVNAELVAPEAEEEIDYIDAGQVVDEEILPLEEEDQEILRIFELEINELGKTLDDLKNLAANDPDYFQVFPYGLNEKQFNELKSILNDTERQKQIIGLDHEVNQSESRSQGDNEVPGSPGTESRTDGESGGEGSTEEPAISAEQLERERAAIEEWIPTSDHEDYISFEWDGQTLEIFKGRDERIIELSRDQLIEEGVKFPEAAAQASINDEFAKWFAGSKIINSDGSPLIVYHGSPTKDIKKFDLAKAGGQNGDLVYGKGIYFTEDKSYADQYRKSDGELYLAYLSIQNPLVISEGESLKDKDLSKYDGVIVKGYNPNKDKITFKEIVAFSTLQIRTIDPSSVETGDKFTEKAKPEFAGEFFEQKKPQTDNRVSQWVDAFNKAKKSNDLDAIQDLYNKVTIYLNGPAQKYGVQAVNDLTQLKNQIEAYAEEVKKSKEAKPEFAGEIFEKPREEKKSELTLVGVVRVDEDVRYNDDQRFRTDRHIAEYRDENGTEFRKSFFVRRGDEPNIPKSGTHDEINALKDQISSKEKPEGKSETKEYKYEMLSRPFGIGTYPKQGFVKSENNPQGHFEILTYNRKLTAQEISHWSFLPLTEVQDIKGKNFVDKDGDYSKITLSWFGNDQYANVSMYDQEGNLVEEPFGLKAAEILKNLEEGYWIEKPATQAEGNQSEKKQKDKGIQNIIIQSPEEGHTDAEDNKTAQDELKRGFKVWKTFFREKGTEKWRKAYILSAPFLTKTNALQSAKMQLIADSKNIPIGREKEVFNNFEFKAEEVVKQEEKSSLSPIQQKQIDEINKEYADLISKKQAEIAQAEKAMKDALLKADERNGLFGDTTPVEADEIIGRDEQGFTYNEATRAAVRKPFEEKIAGINKVIEELKREQKGKIDFVLQQQDLFAEVPAEPATTKPIDKESLPKHEDFGEKIGGARKDMGITRTIRDTDALPAWRRKYFYADPSGVMNLGDPTIDTSKPFLVKWSKEVKSWSGTRTMDYPVTTIDTREPKIFNSEAEAEAYIPIYEVWKQNFRIRKKDGNYVITKTSSTGKVVEYATFPTEEEATTYLYSTEGATSLLNHKREDFSIPALDKVERTGKDWRKGKDISTDEFMETFGFRGGEFGNWVKPEERRVMLNAAYDSFMDLAEILNIPPKAVSLNGELSIAFGARGTKGAAAHFEPERAVINLTRMNGAGSLAHEWAHALDNYFGLQAAKKDYTRNEKGELKAGRVMRTTADLLSKRGMRRELSEIFDAILKATQEKSVTRVMGIDEKQKAYDGQIKRVKDEAETLIRKFENGVRRYKYNRKAKKHEEVIVKATADQIKRAQVIIDKIIEGKGTRPKWAHIPGSKGHLEYSYISPETMALEEVYKEVFGKSGLKRDGNGFYNLGYFADKAYAAREILDKALAGESETLSIPTDFLKTSKIFDRSRANPYWSTQIEMFARAFEYFIETKLEEQNIRADYLQYDKAPVYDAVYEMNPYPAGDERTALNELFQKFFDEVKTKEEGGRTTMFRTSTQVYYSPIEKALEAIKQNKATAKQWKAMLLNNGAKQAELDWMGWDDFAMIFGDTSDMERKHVQTWIDQNRVEIKDITLDDTKETSKLRSLELKAEAGRRAIDEIQEEIGFRPYRVAVTGEWVYRDDDSEIQNVSEEYIDDLDKADEAIQALNEFDEAHIDITGEYNLGGTRYGKYVLPGGKNYKELLLTMPGQRVRQTLGWEQTSDIAWALKGSADIYIIKGGNGDYNLTIDGEDVSWHDTLDEAKQEAEKRFLAGKLGTTEGDFKSSHWDEPNILAHVRFNTRTSEDGKNILFIEEIQSDWAQQGKKKGFRGVFDEQRFEKWYKENKHSTDPTWEEYQELSDSEKKEYRDAFTDEIAQMGFVPNMPFKKTDQWAGLAIRRMIKYAIDEGFDAIAWTTGVQQAERYDLSKVVESVIVSRGTGRTSWKYKLFVTYNDGNNITEYANSPEELESYVGKELAEKIVNEDTGYGFNKTYAGLDLKVGGSGMKAFYDEILPSIANKIGKKHGAQVKEENLPEEYHYYVLEDKEQGTFSIYSGNSDLVEDGWVSQKDAFARVEQLRIRNGARVHSLPITDSMFNAFREGVPMFRRGEVPKPQYETGYDALARFLEQDEADDQRYEAKTRIESLSKELNTPVKAINNRNELPPRVQAQAKRIGVWENETMYGAWDEQTGTMYVLMDDLMKLGPQRATTEGIKTVLHEAVAHKGLPILLGDRGYDNLVSEIYDSIPDDDLTLIRYQYGWTEDKKLIAEEYLGMMAEDNVNPSLFQRIIAKIRQLLRKYFKVAYSKNDVYTLLRASRKNLETAPEEERGFYRSRPQPENFEYAGEYVQAQGTYFRTRKAAASKRNTTLGKAAEAYMEKAAKRTGEETIQGIREYIQDLSLPIRRFEEELLKRGGKQDNNSKPYRDMSLSFGRQEKLYNDYFEGKMKPVLQAVADIKRAGMKGEDILPYIIAKHAIERNQAFRSRELKEWVESHKENVPQDEVDAKMEELKDKDYSGVMGFDTEKKYTNPDELARDIVSEFEGQVDQKLISNLWNKIEGATSEILNTWERGHQITPDQKQEYLSQFRYFVPLRGWREGAAKELVYTKGDGFSRSLQYAKGRKSLADNPLAYLLNVQFQAIAEQVDNEVKTSMVNLIIKNLSNNEMHEMATIKKLYYVKITLPDGTEEWEPTTTRPPQEMFDAGDAKTKIYSEHERLRKPRQAREHEVYVRKPGGDMVMVFNGKHLSTAQAMNKQNYMYRTIFGNIYDARDLNKVMALMGHMNNMLKALYTSWNVVFPFTNFMRDFQEASITQQIKSKSGGKVIKNYRAAFPAIIRRIQGKQNLSNPMDQSLEDFYNLGGATGYTHMKSPEEIEKDINKEVARMVRKGSIAGGIGDAGHALFAAVEHWNKIFEDATRFSVYLSSLAIGNSKQDAAMDAKEASVNFNRKGKGSKAWDAWFAFFNVAVQSMQKNFKLAKDTPKRFTQIAFSFVMLGFLEAMMNALTDDEDDPDSSYYNLNSYMRQNYLVIPLPQIGNLRKKGNKYLSIPLPQFWRGFKSIGSIGFDVATGRMKAGEAVTTALGNFAGGLLPIDVGGFYKSGEFSVAPLVPTITKPVVELIENRNYMGYTIKKEPFTREQAKYLADAGLGKDNVNPAAKFFTDMLFRWSGGDSRYKYYTDKQGRTRKVLLDVNPSTVEHLFKGYTGGTGGVFSDLLTTVSQTLDPQQEVDFKNVPFVNKFLRTTPPAKWNIISEYYDLKEADDRDITLMKEYERQGRQTGNTSQYERMAEDEYRIERKMIFDSYEDQISDLTKGVTKDDMESSSLVIEQMDMCIGEIKRLEARYKRKY